MERPGRLLERTNAAVLAGMLALASTAGAQEASNVPVNLRNLSALAAATTDRAGAISGIVEAWKPQAIERGYDAALWRVDLERVLEARSPGELAAARGAASYEDMIAIASGGRNKAASFGKSVRAAAPADILPQPVLGDDASDLVYFPLAPCRIIDTRIATGAYAGRLAAGTSKDFAHNQQLDLQGGNVAGCGVPNDPAAIALTITAVSPTGAGDLRVWRYGDALPAASVVNYQKVPGLNVANTTIVPTCQLCGLDFSIRADVSAVHVVADVIGYFWKPTLPTAGRAFAKVNRGASPTLDLTKTKGFSAVSQPSTGIYCLTPDPPIAPTSTPVLVSVEWTSSNGNDLGVFVQNAVDPLACTLGQFEIRTFAPSTATLTNNVSFFVFVP